MMTRIVNELSRSGRMPELLAASVAINLLGLGSSLYSTNVLNRYVSVGVSVTLVTLTAGVLIAIGFEILIRRQRQKVLDALGLAHDMRISQRVFDSFAGAAYARLTAVPLAARREALGAPGVMQQLYSQANLAAVLDLPFVMLYVVAVGFLYWPLGLLSALVCALSLALGLLGERQARGPAEQHAKAGGRAQQMGQFLLMAGETIRGLPMLAPLARRWSSVQAGSLGSRRDSMFLQGNQQTAMQTLGQVLSVLVYAFGAVAVVRGELTTGALIGASILSGRAFGVCSRAAYLADPAVRAGRAEAALQTVEAVAPASSGTACPPRFGGKIELFDLAFAYPSQPVPVFERLSLEVTAGKVLVISGPNGSGKSTLIKLMAGVLTPERGMVRADGIELRQLAPAWWHSHAGYAPQEPVFFDGTLRENLLLEREVDEGELLDWIRDMGLEGFLASDAEGLDKHISSHETALAMGLRRRFVLIRAVLTRPQVVFLDDPTEGLDQAGMAAVARLLNRLVTQGCTLVVASNEGFIQRAADWVLDMAQKPAPVAVAQARPATPAGLPQAGAA